MLRNVSSLFVRFPFKNKDHQLHYVSIVVPSQGAVTTVVPRLHSYAYACLCPADVGCFLDCLGFFNSMIF